MPLQVVPIKVKIGLRPNGHHDHPDWNRLPLARVRGERVEDHVIVKWRYDKTSGHEDDTIDSPRGIWYGMLLVTRIFAQEALAEFGDKIIIMTEAEALDFWENKAHAHLNDEDIDTDRLAGLKARRDLMVDINAPAPDRAALDVEIGKALNPTDKTRGVRKNDQRRFADAKIKFGFTIAP